MNLSIFEVKAQGISELSRSDVLDILSNAFPHASHEFEVDKAFFSDDLNYSDGLAVTVARSGLLCGVAFARPVSINLRGKCVLALTVGPLAVAPHVQGVGAGKLLLGGLDSLAKQLGAEAIYLQGIPNFYTQFEYFPAITRSKLRFDVASLATENHEFAWRPATLADLSSMSKIFLDLSKGLQGAASRDERAWRWLLGPASKSMYFQSPQVVLKNDEIQGYFCIDRNTPERVREFVSKSDAAAIEAALQAVTACVRRQAKDYFDIMTWRNSPLHTMTTYRHKTEFIEMSEPRAGQLLKLVDMPRTVCRLLKNHVSLPNSELTVTMEGKKLRLSIGDSSAWIRVESVGMWLFGTLSVASLQKRGDLEISTPRQNGREPSISDFLNSSSAGAFIFQGDNL